MRSILPKKVKPLFVKPFAYYDGKALIVRAPIKTVGESNQREHWTKRNKRREEQQTVLLACLNSMAKQRPALPVVVTFTRIAPRPLDDDNRIGSFKGCRDALAVWLGLPVQKRKATDKRKTWANDSDARVKWRYAEEERNEGVRIYGVEVRFEAAVLPVLGSGR